MVLLHLAACPGCDGSQDEAADTTADSSGFGFTVELNRDIRVLLLDTVSGCEIMCEDPVQVITWPEGRVVASNAEWTHPSVRFGTDEIQLVGLEQSVTAPGVEIRSAGSEPLSLALSNGTWRQYRGALRLLRQPLRTGTVINVVDIETYLVGVVSAELLSSFHEEAFRAQAIAARTYAWYQKRTKGVGRAWDVTATESSQVYMGLEREDEVPKAREAVRDTLGVVCTRTTPAGPRIFCTYYSSTCGGSTQSAAALGRTDPVVPLAGNVMCTYCAHSPHFEWPGPVALDKTEVTRRLRERFPRFDRLGRIQRVDVVQATPAGRPVRFALTDAENRSLELAAEDFRLGLDPTGRRIRSTFFEIQNEEDTLVLTGGHGFGHGVGLCQYGADGLAQTGRSAAFILRFYYPSSGLTRAY